MAGYCRQSAGDIVANAVIKAAPVNAEFNCVRDAFNATSGHKHDGTSTEGAYVPLIADSDANNKVCIDTTNNRVSFFTEVSSNPVEQIRVQDGVIVPVTDDDIDLGVTSTNRFKNLFLSGNITAAGTSTVTGNSTFGGTLGVTGVTTFSDTVCAPGICATGTATLATVDINAGNIDNTVIGATTPVAGSFTTLSTTGQGTFATVDVNGGTIDGAIIGGTTAAAITGTTVTANTCFVGNITGDVTGAVTGNVTGNLTGNVTGNVTGDLTGNVTGNVTGDVTGDLTGAVTGNVTGDVTGDVSGNITAPTPVSPDTSVSTFYDVTINNGLDMTSGIIDNVATPTANDHAATKGYVDTQITNLIGGAPGALDTLNELAAAINDDANAYTTLTTCIGTKLGTAGGTMTGDIALGANKATSTATPTTDDTLTRKGYVDTQRDTRVSCSGGATISGFINMGGNTICNVPNPTVGGHVSNKTYTDTQRDTRLACSGGTVTGTIDMGANKITTTYTPTNAADLTTKTYVDSILGSATCAETSCACAAASATAAATSETNASNSASAAATSASCAASSYDQFDDRYLGSKSSDPTVDNDGDALLTGALYYDTTGSQLKIYTGSAWSNAAFTLGDALTNVVEDTTPQLGGNLDANSKCITNALNVCAAKVYGTSNPTTACQLATKEYVDTVAAAGIHYHDPVRVEREGNLNATYNNGTNGVGATLTNAGTQEALSIDGVTLSLNDRVLIYEQTDATQNGVYTVTNVGSASTNWVLTRSTDTDSYGASQQDALGEGDAFFVLEGNEGAGELYVLTTSGTITFGTTDITFSQIAKTAVYSAGTGITLSGTEFSIGQSVGTSDSVTFNGLTATTFTLGGSDVTSDITGLGTASQQDVGTAANNVVQLNGSAQLPAVDGSQLTGISAGVSLAKSYFIATA